MNSPSNLEINFEKKITTAQSNALELNWEQKENSEPRELHVENLKFTIA